MMHLHKKLVLALILCIAAIVPPVASAGDVQLIYDDGSVCANGCEQIRFNNPYWSNSQYPRVVYDDYTNNYHDNYATAPYFDGAIAPISYPSNGSVKIRFNLSFGSKNYEMTSTLTGLGLTANFTTPPTLNPTAVYSAVHDRGTEDFEWAEWLYGTFRNAQTGTVYAGMYNEYYGGSYNDFVTAPSVYTAMGVARSDNNGSSFYKITPSPGHIFARTNYLYPNGGGASMFGGIFQSPVDQMYYAIINSDTNLGAALFRTNNLDDAMSWRGWSGSAFDVSGQNLGASYYQNLDVYPLYLGWSDYFKKYIAITIGNLTNDYSSVGNNLVVYNLSEDMIKWGPPRKAMYNPACGPDHACTNGEGEIGAYPSIMDPGYLSDTSNSTKSSNGMTGSRPLITYIKRPNDTVHNIYQQFATQKISFEDVVFNRMDNFSMRGVVDGGGRSLVMGFIMQGTESKQFVFRGLGPSLPNIFSYPLISNPRILLYDGSQNLVASNLGWRSLSADDQNLLISKGLNPSSDADSAFVVTIAPGNYTVVMDNGYGIGVIDAFDLSPTAESKIAEVAVRGYGQPADGALTMAFYSRGGQQAIVRGTGTSTLAPFGFSPVIPDPYVAVYDGAANNIISNDNWGTDPNAGVIQSYGLAPGNGAESATMFSTQTTLPSRFSAYSVQLQGTGFGLLDLYNVNPN